MKRIAFFFLAALCFVSTEAFAQTAPETQFGVRVGGNFAQLRNGNDAFGDNTDRKLGLTAGLFAEVPLSSGFAVQPELLYVQKGGAVSESFAGEGDFEGDVRSSFNLDYLELPVLVKFNVPTGSRFAPSLYAGPYAAYNVRRSVGVDFENGDGSGDMGVRVEADDAVQRMNYGAVFGVDFGYRMMGRAATIGARYDLGLSNVFEDGATFSNDDVDLNLNGPEARAHEFSVVLGIAI